MKIVEPVSREIYNSDPMKHIESIGRICYKSEDKITETSAPKFVKGLYNHKHGAMLEHFIFIMEVPAIVFYNMMASGYPFIEGTHDGRYVISASARALTDMNYFNDNGWFNDRLELFNVTQNDLTVAILTIIKNIVNNYKCSELFGGTISACNQPTFKILNNEDLITDNEINRHGWHSVLFRHDRGFTHEMVRMRYPASFAQESTRYCNYNNAEHIEFIMPFKYKEENHSILKTIWIMAMKVVESSYLMLVGDNGDTPQWARGVLPQSVKADIVVTTRNYHWQHILNLRYVGTTGAPHPQMKEAMQLLTESADWAAEMIGAQNL